MSAHDDRRWCLRLGNYAAAVPAARAGRARTQNPNIAVLERKHALALAEMSLRFERRDKRR
ncbi:MAG TPA: hypothetical protein VFB32_01555 [Rudaea sp.]|nr:hypothetical protein [Rudaea sp.]